MLTLARSLRIYLFLVILFFIYRTSFALYFSPINFLTENFDEVLKAFFMGWRYDTMIICYVLAPFFLINLLTSFIPLNLIKKITSSLSFIYFLLIILLLLVLLIGDLGFYSYFQTHLNILAFGFFEDDTQALVETMNKNYPLKSALIAFGIFALFVLWFLKKVFKNLTVKYWPIAFRIPIFLIFFVLFAGGIRGGYSVLVLSPKYADFSKHQIINDISLNGIITFERAYKLRSQRTSFDFNMAQAMGYGDNIQKAFSDYLGLDVSSTQKDQLINLIQRKTPTNEQIENTRPNVVVLLMESFGGHWLQYNTQEFNFLGELDNHFKEDYLFENIISGDNGTIGSLMVIGTNIPHRSGARFISESRYLNLPLISSAQIPYKKRGYETTFLYGGKLSWRDIGRYFKNQGFDKVEGESHIRDNLKLSGRQGTEWGLYDEHFFDHIYKELNSGSSSKFIMALSTTNHPPFETPKSYKKLPLKISEKLKSKITREEDLFKKRFEAFQYSNQKLAKFISQIKNSKLSENTIVVVTGDHNFWGFMNYSKEESFSKYKVPLYFYIPKSLRPKNFDKNTIGGHEDIMTTTYNLSLSDTSFYAFGEDLFNSINTNSLGASIYANKTGGFYRGKQFIFEPVNSGLIKFDQNNTVNLDILKKSYRSTLSIADFLLRSEYAKRLKK